GRMGEVVGAAADFLAQKADTEVMLAIAERTSDAEEFIRRARYAKDNYTAMSREAAERICDVEEKYYSQSNGNRSVMEALRGFESDRCFYPGMARLVEMAIEGKRGAALVNALDSLGRTTRLYESPFSCNSYIRNVGYSDYDEGIRLAAALFGERRNMERIMNLSYAIHAVGAEKAKELYNKFGMEYFFRYSQEVLQEVARNADPASSPEKPILLAVFPKSDWNDAFYGYKDSLRKLAGYYRIMVVEVGSQDSLYERVNSVAGWYGKRISALVLGGHGSPASISLGGRGQYRMINISDTEEMERMRDSLVDGPVIVLNSCSTGAYGGSIAGVLARVLNARVYAPTRDSSLYDFMLDGEGGINGALYEGAATREYYSGTSEIVE
ncbi:MAG TPA: hypothetical protein PKJ97_03125, partial [Candidatus Bilamarchaeaceae archaeon]|nr:hypothetical protein [Candidatus Bilamarchaeaceae archaeon]